MAGCREYMADAVVGRHPRGSGRGAEDYTDQRTGRRLPRSSAPKEARAFLRAAGV
jgi:hypothetical protein